MNTRSIEVVGTLHGCWAQWVRQVLPLAGRAGVNPNPNSSQELEAMLRRRLDSNVLMLVEHPAIGLAHSLGRGDDIDPEAWLDDWLAIARTLVAYAQRHPETTLVVNADEVQRRPQRLAQLLQSRWGELFSMPSRVAVQGYLPDALTHALAWSFIERESALQDVVPELMASCVVLPGLRSASTRPPSGGIVDGAESARRLAELMRIERRLAQVECDREAEGDGLRCELQAAADKIAQLTTAVQTLEVSNDRMMARTESAERELVDARSRLDVEISEHNALAARFADAASRQDSIASELTAERENAAALGCQLEAGRAALVQAQEQRRRTELELTHATEQRSSIELELTEATVQCGTLKRELTQVKVQSSTLKQEHASAKEAARAASEEGDLLRLQLHQVQDELERVFLAKRDAENALLTANTGVDATKLEQDLRSAREECELLTLQSHQVQQELERVHEEKVQLAHELKSRVLLPGLDDVVIGEVTVVGVRDSSPHREISFIVREARAGERHVAEAAVRLVEHWGRPGLVIFADEGRTALFKSWRESGREDGRPYMLLVHGEAAAQRVYDTMSTLDWKLVQVLAIRLEQALQDRAGDLSPVWRSLAQRLLTSLREQPARLRFDNVVVTPIEHEPAEKAHLGLTLERASYHGRTWQRLPIQWQPTSATPSLDLGSDEESGPPLLAWPADADGAPVRTLRLPLGDDPDAEEIHAVWDTLSGSDRAFVAELLNLMPILATHLQAAAVTTRDSAQQIDLLAAATNTMLFGRTALQPPRGAGPRVERRRPLLLRMARRLGVSAKQTSATDPAPEPALDR